MKTLTRLLGFAIPMVAISAATAQCPGDGDCCSPNDSAGCSDAVCCELVCAEDSYCCEVEWDTLCANQACAACANCACDNTCPGEGSCCDSNGSPGCDIIECCNTICGEDPFCCDVEWDDLCVFEASFLPLCGCEEPCLADAPCSGDLNDDGSVLGEDLALLLGNWNETGLGDLNCDGVVNHVDLATLLGQWGPCDPVPTGACCLDDGECIVTGLIDCIFVQDGSYVGDGVPCGDVGACCFGDGTCAEINEVCCDLFGGAYRGAGVACADTTCCAVDIDVNTDRKNGIHDDDDEGGEHKWTIHRGAFFFVNVDDDQKNSKPDSVEYDKDEKVVVQDIKINANNDANDITPIVIRAFGDLTNKKVILKVKNLNQIKAIHVFDEIAEDKVKFWGGPAETVTEMDITARVSATEDKTFGIEGLKYRLIKGGGATGLPAIAGLTNDMLFDGFVQFELLCKDAGTGQLLGKDEVLLKVAPYLMLPNSQPSEKVFATILPGAPPGPPPPPPRNNQFLKDIAGGLAAAADLVKHTGDGRWGQDQLEIGYSQTPETSARISLYIRHQHGDEAPAGLDGDPKWQRTQFLGATPVAPNIGIYRNPRVGDMQAVKFQDGQFGGNIEVTPPSPKHKLGRICVGTTISKQQERFFASQEVQPPFTIDTKWLAVGHVDEIVSYWRWNKATTKMDVIIASPRLAYTILKYQGTPVSVFPPPTNPGPVPPAPAGEPEDIPDHATFFAIGATAEGIAEEGTPTTLVDFDADFMDPSQPIWQFVRIYDGTGAGQIAHIEAVLDANTLLIDLVWADYPLANPPFIPDTEELRGAGRAAGLLGFVPDRDVIWHDGIVPDATSKYVLLEDTLYWPRPEDGAPAGFPFFGVDPATVNKKDLDPTIAKGRDLRFVNIDAQKKIETVRQNIIDALKPDVPNFIEVPVIYTARLVGAVPDKVKDNTARAWTPGAANILFANGKLFIAKQRGPTFTNGAGMEEERFSKAIDDAIDGTIVWVEDFKNYHKGTGEVHCGSNTLREIFSFKWWERQPTLPSLP